VLGRDAEGGWHRADGRDDLVQLPEVVVFRWEAPLFFANAGLFRQHLRALVRDRQPRWIVLQCEAVTDVDVTAAEKLEQLDRQLNEQGVHLAFVEMRDRLAELLLRYGLFDTLDRDHFYDSVEEALAAIAAEDERGGR
jgi:MFS superfamily sulfate permease-like transporter